MAWPDHLGPFGTKRRCGVALCICIFTDLIILAIYWNRIGDALENPVRAIIKSVGKDPKGPAEIIKWNNNGSSEILPQNDSSTTRPWWDTDENPSVGRLLYHFAGALLYICYTSMNSIILLNTIARIYYIEPKYKALLC